MEKKKVQVLATGQCIEKIVEILTDLKYIYLDNSEFSRGRTIEQTMNKRPYRCYHLRNRRINFKTIEEIDIWNPKGKVYCELRFDLDGLSESSSVTIGKNQFKGKKAFDLAEKNIILCKQ